MPDTSKIKSSHTSRLALVYVRQSSPSQVENNKESTARQYALANRARDLGWAADQVTVIDEDLGISGASAANRSGFGRLITEVAFGRAGIVLGLEVSRLARNNADWYRLIELCSVTDTLLGDNDGIYHPALFNDRLVLGVHHVGNGTPCDSRPLGRRHPQQGSPWRIGAWSAGWPGLGRA